MSTTTAPAIGVEGLTKRFGDVTAVDGITYRVERGEVFGFLGPNGAGKTTTTRMLTGVLRPDAGSARIAGHDVRTDRQAAKRSVGIVPEGFDAYPDLSAWRNLLLAGELYGVPREIRRERADDLLESFGLSDRRSSPASQFSKGMKQRLMLAMALIHDPDVLFLDEPISGLDVESQRLIRERIDALNEAGHTIFLTTHDLAEAEALCDRVAIIDRGTIAAIDSPEALTRTIERTQAVEVAFETGQAAVDRNALADLRAVENVERCGEGYRLGTADPHACVESLLAFTRADGARIRALHTCGPSLEDAFVALTEGDL
ncbi:MAG: ABC transporter ATP-binding protein [Haloferacaceae archaeon]